MIRRNHTPYRILTGIGFLISIFIILIILYYSNTEKMIQVLLNIDIIIIAIIFIVALSTSLLKAFRWHFLLKNSGIEVDFKISCYSFFAGALISIFTPGRLGEPIRAYFLKKLSNNKMSTTLSLIIIERFSDLLLLVILSIFGILLLVTKLTQEMYFFIIIAIFSSLAIIFIILLLFNKNFGSFLINTTLKKIEIVTKLDIELFYNTIDSLKHNQVIVKLFLLTFLVWIFEAITLYFGLYAIGFKLSLWICLTIVSISILVGLVSFLPGGIGSSEAVLVILLSTFFINISAISSSVFLYRITMYTVIISLGLISQYFLNFGLRHDTINYK